MTSLDQFLKPIQIAGEPLRRERAAYKMDEPHSESGMRRFVGLGECNCCDYFLPQGNAIVLIEETQLSRSVTHIRKEYSYLDDRDKDDLANRRIREEIRLKAYGSMLVLCRLTAKSPDAKAIVQGKKYAFWLVASSTSTEDKRVFDNLKDDLLNMLKGALGKEILDNVEMLPSEALETRLLSNAPTP